MERTTETLFKAWLREHGGDRTQGHIAEYVGVSPSTVSRWVAGEAVPETRNIRRLAKYFKVAQSVIEGLFPEKAPTESDTRELIRATVHETLAQMGHPRVAASVGEVVAAFDAAIEGLPPADLDAISQLTFLDGLTQVRDLFLAGGSAPPPRSS